LLLLALGLSFATYHLVESRMRFAPWLVASRGRTWALAAGLVCIGGAGAAGLRAGFVCAPEHPAPGPLLRSRAAVASLPGCEGPTPCRVRTGSQGDLLLIGDSHAMHWAPALEVVAEKLDLGLLYSGRQACPPIPSVLLVASEPCDAWRADLRDLGRRVAPR